MCLRYQWEYDQMDRDMIEVEFNRPGGSDGGIARESGEHEAFPASLTPIIILENEQRIVVPSYFGMTPPWAKDETFGKKYAYNSRSETINQKPTFKAPLREGRRCIIKVVSFMENLGRHRWLRIYPAQPATHFYIAGLYELPNQHRDTRSHCLVTTTPNSIIEPYHDRMPVILSEKGQEVWLNPETKVFDALELLQPCPSEWMIMEEIEEKSSKQKYLDFD